MYLLTTICTHIYVYAYLLITICTHVHIIISLTTFLFTNYYIYPYIHTHFIASHLSTNYNMYTYINNFCHEIQCLTVKEWITIEHEVDDNFFCANSINLS